MDASIFIVGKFLLSSALLMALYWFVLRNRASYRLSRLYLLTLPILSALMSGLTYEVTLPAGLMSEVPAVAQREAMAPQADAPQQAPMYLDLDQMLPRPNLDTAPVATDKVPVQSAHRSIDYGLWLMLIVPAVSVILLLMALFYVSKLLWLKSRLKVENDQDGYDLIRSADISTPFSFGRIIFLPNDLDSASERMILSHEKAHIEHHHYLDVWLMEFLTRLLWFNPVVWLCRSELSNVHEFEADRDVISQGANIHAYQTTLLEMVMSESSPVVNGFNKSFIRQRFIEMKKTSINTLGRMGKFGTFASVFVIACLFIISCKQEKSNIFRVPELSDPKLFVLEGMVDPQITDSCYNIYLSDEYFHIDGEKPDTCIQVVGGKFHYELPLTKTIAGRVRCIFPGGELCSAWIDLWFVPGETLNLEVHNGYYHIDRPYSYQTKAERAMYAVRNVNDMKNPHMPEFSADKVWEKPDVSFLGNSVLSVERVYFGKEETIVLFTTNEVLNSVSIPGNIGLQDNDGHIYKLTRAISQPVDDNWTQECRTFGFYCAFEPMPANTDKFVVADDVENLQPQMLFSVSKPKPTSTEPNFTLHIVASQGINDSGYLIRVNDYDRYGDGETVADLPINENRECTFTYHLEEECIGLSIATFPDGSVCTHCERFPFVPGETAELRVYNGYYHLTGTGFYREWGNADDACENASKYTTPEEAREKQLAYLHEHINEPGCVAYFDMQTNIGIKSIYEALPESMKATKQGQRLKKEYDLWCVVENEPLYVIHYKVDGKIVEGMVDKELAENLMEWSQVAKQTVYRGDDPDRPLSAVSRSQNGVILLELK